MAVDQQQLSHGFSQFLYDDVKTGALYIRIGQTITPQVTGFLTQAKLWLSKAIGTMDGELVVEVRDAQDADFTGSNKDIGNLLTSQSVDPDLFSSGTGGQVTVNFSSPTYLTSGTQYSIILKLVDSTLQSQRIKVWGAGSNVYANGKWQWKQESGSWSTPPDDIYFITDLSMNTIWEDVDCDIRTVDRQIYDINGDIRVVSTHTVLRNINSDIRSAQRVISDINADIRVLENYDREYDINSDIRVSELKLYDINCDIRCQGEQPNAGLYNIDCDIRVTDREFYDVNTDIRCKEDNRKLYDVDCDIRVKRPIPVGLDGFRVYLDGDEIEDVDSSSIKWRWTQNEIPATASFRIVRKSDDFNKTLEDVSQAINTDLPIEIKFNDNLRYYGYVVSLDVEQSGESVVVNCVDRKVKLQEKKLDISYGRKWESLEPGNIEITNEGSTGEALIEILDQLITDGIISSYSGVPDGIIPEYQETEGMPSGTLITELLNLSGNYYWNITPAGILEIYKSGDGTLKNLPIQEPARHIHLYDVINYNFKLNDRSNLITDAEVNMGTESEEERASFRIILPHLIPAWDSQYDNMYNQGYGDSEQIEYYRTIGILSHFKSWLSEDVLEKRREVGRKWRISNWTDGSFIDNTFPSYVIGNYYKIKGWSWDGEFLNLATPLMYVKKSLEFVDQPGEQPGYITEYGFNTPYLIGRFYKKETVSSATSPTVFDVNWNGIAGAGGERKLILPQLGIRDSVGWTVYEDGQLVAKSEQGYNDTEYATDRANLILSRINDPITEGTIELTFDAFDYYNPKLGNKINLTGTEEANIYNNVNGFPLDVQSIDFDVGSYIVTLNTEHLRSFKATKNFR